MMRASPAFVAWVLVLLAWLSPLPSGPGEARAAEPAAGLISVTANVAGARVTIDGKSAGTAPLTAPAAPGPHRVLVEAPGHDPFSRSIEVEAGKKVLVEAFLVRVAAALEVRVNVDGAQVFLDDRAVGTGGRVLIDPVQPGGHVLKVSKPGFETWAGRVTVFRGQTQVIDVKLASAFGSLSVETEPPGARVWIDGRERGVSPVVVEGLEAGLHSVRLVLKDHAEVFQSVSVERQRKAVLRVAIPESGGTLTLRASPGTPRLFLDGCDLGEHAELTLPRVAAGVHNVRATLSGHTDGLATVRVTEGGSEEVSLRLLEARADGQVASARVVSSVDRGRAAPWVILGIAVAAGAGIGIAVAVDASDVPPAAEPVDPPAATVGVVLP